MKSPNKLAASHCDSSEPKSEDTDEGVQRETPPSSMEHCILLRITPERKVQHSCNNTPLQTIQECESNASEGSKRVMCTPLKNPFDVKAEALYLPSCSPSIFSTLSENKENKRTFRWSIEQLSVLYPADIDETSTQDTWMDPEQETEAQKAIDTFFSQNHIVPSPWTSSGSSGEKSTKQRRHHFNKKTICGHDASTQTELSLPPHLDLRAILGQYFTYNEEQEESSPEKSYSEQKESSSFLRRKLFAAEENYSSPLLLSGRKSYADRKPLLIQTIPCFSTPSSDVFSSSPITPRNCSGTVNMISPTSPAVSPIAAPSRASSRCGRETLSFRERLEESESQLRDTSELSSSSHMMSIVIEDSNLALEPQECTSRSERHDTGYVTGSIHSAQSLIVPEGFCKSQLGLTATANPIVDSMVSKHPSEMDSAMSLDGSRYGTSVTGYDLKNEPWIPIGCSTPTKSS